MQSRPPPSERSCRGGFPKRAGLLSLHQTDAIALAGETMGDRAA
jgi:hypothetical protein